MTIEELKLEPVAEQAARLLQQKHPNIEFTSGRRNVAQQAHAMAANIVSLHDRQWIGKTYLAGAVLQKWVDDHPNAVTIDQITAGLQETMSAMAEADLLKISRHLTGRAFDLSRATPGTRTLPSFSNALTFAMAVARIRSRAGSSTC